MWSKVRGVAAALSGFAAERFPLRVTGPLAAALAAGPYAAAGGGAVGFMRSAMSVFLVLLAVRIVDDIRSIADDRVCHPERGLASGRIAVRPLGVGAICSLGTAFLVSAGTASAALALLALAYAAYFAVERRIPLVARPPAVNTVFVWIPVHVALIGQEFDPATAAGFAAFFWLPAVGHDYLHDLDESAGTTRTVRRHLGVASCAGGFSAGAWLALRGGVAQAPPLFLAGLVLLFTYLGYLVARSMVRPIYVAGFAAFALPSALLGLDRLLGLWVG